MKEVYGSDRCPNCGRLMAGTFRFGIRVGAAKAAIVDLIEGAGPEGISANKLHAALTKMGRNMVRQTLRSHIYQLRIALEVADIDVVSETFYANGERLTVYSLIRRASAEARHGKENGKSA